MKNLIEGLLVSFNVVERKQIYNALSLLILIFFTTSCCEDALRISISNLLEYEHVPIKEQLVETLELSIEAKAFFPYPEEDKVYVFTNNKGDKEFFLGEKQGDEINYVNTFYYDRTQEYYKVMEQRMHLSIKDSRKLDRYVPYFNITTTIEIDTALLPSDEAFNEVTLFRFFLERTPMLLVKIDHDFNTTHSVILNGKSFDEVYIGRNPSGHAKFYYSKELGVVGYEDHNGEIWTLNALTVQEPKNDSDSG